jgi:hypothetical protein
MKSTMNGWLNRRHMQIAAVLGMLLPLTVHAEHDRDRSSVIQGKAVTGINEFCGSPVFNLPLPSPLPPTLKATNLGEYNPGGALPFPLSSTNCSKDIVVTTTTDLDFLGAAGIPDVNPALKNIPLRQNYVITGQDGSRSRLPSLDQVPGNALPPTTSNPNSPITLGKWLNAKGRVHIECKSNGKATIEASFRNLIANGVYSMWGVWTTPPPGPPIVPVPLGGLPNALVPDRHGEASFFRELASCPFDATKDGSLLMFITLAYHSDSDLNGTNPELGAAPTIFHPPVGDSFTTTLVPGVATHDAMEFPVNVDFVQ